MKHCGFARVCYEIVDVISGCCYAGCGCNEEVYWNEWHNDPPRCCDPCDCYGNWTGPGSGPYHAPYAHPYAPHGYSEGGYAAAGRPHAQYAPEPQYARNNNSNHATFGRSNMKTSSPQQQSVAYRGQPARPKNQVARSRGAAANVIRR
jgi:hypothetical protein